MDWSRSYFTMADANIEYNWHFLKHCHGRGWLYKGHRPMPWCARCGTSISQHEMLDAYAELTHESVTVALPLLDRADHRLLVWTTTPWTLPANVAVAVNPELDYAECAQAGTVYYLAASLVGRYPALGQPRRTVKGAELAGLRYVGPFDDLPVQRGVEHRVVAWEEVSAEEGTGLVHIAPGCGLEDFELSRRHGLPVIAPVTDDGRYLDGFGVLSGTRALDAAAPVAGLLKERHVLFARAPYRHRYPTCWRCAEELIFRVADEWFIDATEIRSLARAANEGVTWRPGHMQLRMDDWLANMGDWCISRKRYWACPCPSTRVDAGASPWSARAASCASWPSTPGRWTRSRSCTARGSTTSSSAVQRVRSRCAGSPRSATAGSMPASCRSRRWATSRTASNGALVPRRLHRRGGGAAPWVVLRAALHVHRPGRPEPYRTVLAHERVLASDGREMHKSWGMRSGSTMRSRRWAPM